MSTNSNTIATLNHLIETSKDGQEGFRAASEDVKSPSLRAMLDGYSLQRAKFVGELQSLAHSLGESDPENSGSVVARLHRGWMDMISALTSKDEHSILAECARGEDSAVAQYKEALADELLPQNICDVIARQSSEIQAAHDEIRDLRDATAPSAK